MIIITIEMPIALAMTLILTITAIILKIMKIVLAIIMIKTLELKKKMKYTKNNHK